VLFIGTLQNGLSLAGLPSFWQQVVTGVILVLAVGGDRLAHRASWSGPLGRRFGRFGGQQPATPVPATDGTGTGATPAVAADAPATGPAPTTEEARR
jgi:hypothetical protein